MNNVSPRTHTGTAIQIDYVSLLITTRENVAQNSCHHCSEGESSVRKYV